MDTTRDKLSLIQGQYKDGISAQLMKNENYLYLSTGGLEERGGGAKVTNAPTASSRVYGFDNFKTAGGTDYFITVQGTKIYYYNSGWNDFGLALSSNKQMRFESAGAGTNRAFYGVNGYDSVTKITGTPTAAAVASSPTTCRFIKLHKNRLFAIDNQDRMYYTDASAFDTWNTGANYQDISPGTHGNLQALAVWGDSLFIFKETAVFVLPNASSSPSDWAILKADALTGTQSPDTVKTTQIGIMYLSSDNRVRLISPSVTFSSNEYTLGGSGSPSVSICIQEDLNSLLLESSKANFYAYLFKDLYILNFRSVNSATAYNDQTYFADTSKFISVPDADIPQPFWGKFTGFNYDYMTAQDSGTLKLYGVKGAIDGSQDGQVHETLNAGIHNDNGSPIRTKAIVGWIAPGGPGLYKKIKQIYLVADVEDWYLNLNFNSFKLGGDYPEEGTGTARSFYNETGGGSVGSGLVGTATVGQLGISTKKYRVSLKGHYFIAEFYNYNADEFTRIIKMIVYFRPIKQA